MPKSSFGKLLLRKLEERKNEAVAAAGATALVESEEAEASVIDALVKKIAKEIDSTLRETAPSKQSIENVRKRAFSEKTGSPAARRRERMREQSPETIIQTPVQEEKIITPEEIYEQFKGRGIVPLSGDVTDAGTVIEQVAGVKLKRPVKMEGGYKFSDANEGDWASMGSAAAGQSSLYKKAAEEFGDDPVAMFVGMSETSGNFSTMLPEVAIDMLETLTEEAKIPEKALERFDRELRNLSVINQKTKKEVKRFPDWKGISKKLGEGATREERFDAAYNQLLESGNGEQRKAFMETLSKADYRDLGFPDWRDIYEATTAPRLIDQPKGSSGAAIMIPDTHRGFSLDPEAHRTYSHRIHGKQDLGSLIQNIPWENAFPKTARKLKEMGKTPSQAYRSLQMSHQMEPIDQEWLDSVMGAIDEKSVSNAFQNVMTGQAGNTNTPAMAFVSLLTGLGALASAEEAEGSVFTSMLTNIIENIPMKKGSPEQMVNMLKKGKGVSPKELEMIDWEKMPDQKSITREDFAKFVEAERPKIDVVSSLDKSTVTRNVDDLQAYYDRKFDDGDYDFETLTKSTAKWNDPKYDEVTEDWRDKIIKLARDQLDIDPDLDDVDIDLEDLYSNEIVLPADMREQLKREIYEADADFDYESAQYADVDAGVDREDIYEGYTLSGPSENYREIYFNLDDGSGVALRSGHMNQQPNNLGWARATDRTGPDGEKILNIEEIQSDAAKSRAPEELRKALPKDWRSKYLNAVMKMAKDEGYDGVTFAKTPSQVAEIEGWSPPGNVSGVEFYKPNLTEEELLQGDAGYVRSRMAQFKFISPEINQDNYDWDDPRGNITEMIAGFKDIIGRLPDDNRNAIQNAEEILAGLEDLKSQGVELRIATEADVDDVSNYREGLQTVIKQYTEGFPKSAEKITGKPVESISIDGRDLNYVPLKDTEIPEPVFFGKQAGEITPQMAVVSSAGGAMAAPEIMQEEIIEEEIQQDLPITLGQQLFPEVEEPVIEEVQADPLKDAAMKYAETTVAEKAAIAQVDPQAAAQDDSIFNQVAEWTKEAWTGEERLAQLPEDVRNLPEVGEFGRNIGTGDLEADLKIAYARLFGSDEELEGVIGANDPNSFIEEIPVAGGDPVKVVTFGTGVRALLNKPGATQADINPLIGEAIQFAPAVKAVSMAKPLGVAGQTGLGMATFGATDVARQEALQGLGSGQEFDPWSTAINTVFGAYPAAGPAFQAAKGQFGKLVNPIQEALEPAIKALNTDLAPGSESVTTSGLRK